MNSGQLHRRPFTDYFLHELFFAEAGVVHRARVLVIALYVFVATTIAAIPTLFLTDHAMYDAKREQKGFHIFRSPSPASK